MRFWCHHAANYNTSSPPSSTPRLKISQYRSTKFAKNNAKTEESPLQSILNDLKTHYQSLDPSAREYALVRDLVHDWNDRRLLAYWKCLEHHPRKAVEIVRLMGLDFGESKLDAVIKRALGTLREYRRRDRFEVVAGALQRVGNADAVLELDDPQFVLGGGLAGSEGAL